MQVTQDAFERVVEHCSALLEEHDLGIEDQLDALGLYAEGIATLAEAAAPQGVDAPFVAARALCLGVLIGVQLCREGFVGEGSDGDAA